jgi:hypothetical protein
MESRQQSWQKEKIEAGLCSICGKEKLFSSTYCKTCLIKRRVRNRKITNYRPQEETGMGRPRTELLRVRGKKS